MMACDVEINVCFDENHLLQSLLKYKFIPHCAVSQGATEELAIIML
jgi:hypothetical protein